MPANATSPLDRAQRLLIILSEDGPGALSIAASSLRHADIAEAFEALASEPGSERNTGTENLQKLFLALPPLLAAEILEELSPELRDELLEASSDARLMTILTEARVDDAIYFLDHLDEERSRDMLARLDARVRDKLEEQYELPDDCAGRIMVRQVLALPPFMTAKQAVNRVRALGKHEYGAIYVVNTNSVLLGVLSLRDLVFAEPATAIEKLMNVDVVSSNLLDDQELVADTMHKYHLFAIPVVDDDHHLRGMVTWDDAADILEEEAEEDLLAIAGTTENLDDNEGLLQRARHRLPYLLVTTLGGFIMATMIDAYKENIQAYSMLIAFLPLIPALAGNVGIQCSTVTLRSIAIGEISPGRMKSRAVREIGTGIFLALILSALCTLGVLGMVLWQNEMHLLAGIIGIAMVLAVCMAACFGVLVPLICLRANIDPAIAAGPFITMLNDIFGMAIYLGTAIAMLNIFI